MRSVCSEPRRVHLGESSHLAKPGFLVGLKSAMLDFEAQTRRHPGALAGLQIRAHEGFVVGGMDLLTGTNNWQGGEAVGVRGLLGVCAGALRRVRGGCAADKAA